MEGMRIPTYVIVLKGCTLTQREVEVDIRAHNVKHEEYKADSLFHSSICHIIIMLAV